MNSYRLNMIVIANLVINTHHEQILGFLRGDY